MRIVVIEDEENMCNSLVRMIRSINPEYKVVGTALNGEDGAAVIEKTMPDVVFTDIRMPRVDGLEMIRLLNQKQIRTHYVIISAYSDFEYAQKAIRLGAGDYLLKPIAYEDVERTLLVLSDNKITRKVKYALIDEMYPVPENANPIVQEAIRYIHENYSRQISMKDISDSYNVTYEYFSRIFSADMGIGFTGYLKEFRINTAQQLLKDGKYRIQDIANMVGYENINYFCKVFKDTTGYTPTVYARLVKN